MIDLGNVRWTSHRHKNESLGSQPSVTKVDPVHAAHNRVHSIMVWRRRGSTGQQRPTDGRPKGQKTVGQANRRSAADQGYHDAALIGRS